MPVTFTCSRCGNEWSAHSLAVAQECRRCNPIPAAMPPAEPTTAEAFSILRDAQQHSGWTEEADRALALLERRMQEMERVSREYYEATGTDDIVRRQKAAAAMSRALGLERLGV